MNHEETLINAFVRSAKRARFIELLGNPKRRRRCLDDLYHFKDLDPRYLISIPPGEQHAKNIAALLAARGAPSFCHVISTDAELDGRDLVLVDVLEQIVGFGEGTLISYIPGRLGYFEGEDHRFILERSVAQQALAAVGGQRRS
jgi:hypothetical protein